MEKNFKQIKTIKQLKDLLEIGCGEFFILLKGGGRSWKTINFSDKLDKDGNNKIEVLNEIDETRQVLTEKNILNPRYTNIGTAMQQGSFYYAWT